MDTDNIGSLLDEIVPNSLAESWDNPGWQVRLPGREISGILLVMDVVPATVDEAARLGFNLMVAHHPLLFRPLQRIDLASPTGRLVGALIGREISVWAAHTNLDVMPWGTSFALAEVLGLSDIRPLSRVERPEYKLVVYVPPSHVDAVKESLAEAGVGRIGRYSHCFWQVLGTGQFRPEQGASPYQGRVGEEERLEEFRLEGVVPHSRLGAALQAMRQAHPYEEIAYDLLPLTHPPSLFGFGAVGELPKPTTTARLARDATARLSSPLCQVAGDPRRTHRRVAVVGGSGSSFLSDAVKSGATLFITADVRYHDAQEAVARGLDLVILDHFSTERPALEAVRQRLEERLPDLPVRVGVVPSSPYARVKL